MDSLLCFYFRTRRHSNGSRQICSWAFGNSRGKKKFVFSAISITNSFFLLNEISVILQNWAFVARFCFLSEEGKFEYEIEYEHEYYGFVNLLLYYDTETQWSSVYKTNKVR